MGEVWNARDTRLDRIAALRLSDAQFSERFEREAKAIAALNHPNMEYLRGCATQGAFPDRSGIDVRGADLRCAPRRA
jgi:serine/threonine protein kinase